LVVCRVVNSWLSGYKATTELDTKGIKAMLLRLPEFLKYAARMIYEEEKKKTELLELAEKVNAAILQ